MCCVHWGLGFVHRDKFRDRHMGRRGEKKKKTGKSGKSGKWEETGDSNGTGPSYGMQEPSRPGVSNRRSPPPPSRVANGQLIAQVQLAELQSPMTLWCRNSADREGVPK